MSTSEASLVLEGALDVERVGGLWPGLRARCQGIRRIDLSAVTLIDSSGVAMVRALQAACATQGQTVEVVGVPPRFAQICLAHRVEAE